MIIETKMMYLGFDERESKKTNSRYLLVKMMEMANSSIYEFYVPNDRIAVITSVGELQQFMPVEVTLEMTSFNNKPQIDLVKVENQKISK